MKTRIGTVEILRDRIYSNRREEEVAVKPGFYPIYQEGERVYFEASGRKSVRVETTFTRILEMESAFVLQPAHDQPTPKRTRIRKSFTIEGLDDPVATEGHEEQRLRFSIQEGRLASLRGGA
jgi:hypothetical protein